MKKRAKNDHCHLATIVWSKFDRPVRSLNRAWAHFLFFKSIFLNWLVVLAEFNCDNDLSRFIWISSRISSRSLLASLRPTSLFVLFRSSCQLTATRLDLHGSSYYRELKTIFQVTKHMSGSHRFEHFEDFELLLFARAIHLSERVRS